MASSEKLPYVSKASMDTVTVAFIPDDEVKEMILSRKERDKALLRKKREEERKNNESVSVVPTTPKGKERKLEDPDTLNGPTEPAKKAKLADDDLELALAALEVEKESLTSQEGGDVAKNVDSKKISVESPNSTVDAKTINNVEKINGDSLNKTQSPLENKTQKKEIQLIQRILENSDDEEITAPENDSVNDPSHDDKRKKLRRSSTEVPASENSSKDTVADLC